MTGAAVGGVVGAVLAEGAGEAGGLTLPDGFALAGGAGVAVGAGLGVAGPGVAGRADFVGPVEGATQLGAGVGLNSSLQVYVERDAFT